MTYLLKKRISETCIIVFISSCIISFLINTGVLTAATKYSYPLIFGTEALLFLIPSFYVMRKHFRTRNYRKETYMKVNLWIFAVLFILNILGLLFLPDEIYTVFFGYTKMLRHFGVWKLPAMLIFYAFYLLDIYLAYWLRHDLRD